jgi:hypothetical protein
LFCCPFEVLVAIQSVNIHGKAILDNCSTIIINVLDFREELRPNWLSHVASPTSAGEVFLGFRCDSKPDGDIRWEVRTMGGSQGKSLAKPRNQTSHTHVAA